MDKEEKNLHTQENQAEEKDRPDQEKRNVEDIFRELEDILSGMQDPEVSLEESFRLYEKGMKDIHSCSTMLDQIEKKMQIIAEDGSLKPFDAEEE